MIHSSPFIDFTEDESDPPIPEDANLQSMRWFKLDIMNLLNSDFIHRATHEELGAAFVLWTKSVHQLPAGSLPNDDVVLARMAGFDPRSKRWKRSREMILYGWYLCSDGRLYHDTVAGTILDVLGKSPHRPGKESPGTPSGFGGEAPTAKDLQRKRQQRYREKRREAKQSSVDGGPAAGEIVAEHRMEDPQATAGNGPDERTSEAMVTLPRDAVSVTGDAGGDAGDAGGDASGDAASVTGDVTRDALIDRDRDGDIEQTNISVTRDADGDAHSVTGDVTKASRMASPADVSAPGGAGVFVIKPVGCGNEKHSDAELPNDHGAINPEPKVEMPGKQRPSSRFEEFWGLYPSKVGKKPALQKWRAMKLDLVADDILADVRARLERDRKWCGGYTPNPVTYLNQERWKDQWDDGTSHFGNITNLGRSSGGSASPSFAGLSKSGQKTAMAVRQWLEKEEVR